jgi:hypothetical protein
MQTFSVELDRRQQVKLVRRMLVTMLTEWGRLPVQMVVGCVPGNHGENRRGGKAFTTFEDNDDLAVFEQAAGGAVCCRVRGRVIGSYRTVT